MLKRSLKFLLLAFMVFTATFVIISCGRDYSSKIYIIPEAEFESCVKTDDLIIEKLKIKNLEKADLEELVTGEKYYAVMCVKGALITEGGLSLGNESEIDRKNVYRGAKNGCSVKATLTSSGDYVDFVPDPSNQSNTEYWLAAGFVANDADEETFSCSFTFEGHIYENAQHRYADMFYVNKKILHHKQITAEPSIKYLSYGDYMSGDYDGKLKEIIEAPIGEKFFAVIDYKLSSFKDIEETDTVTVSISAKSEYMPYLTLGVEEIPTSDYKVISNALTATFKLKDGGEAGKTYRFIVFIRASDRGNINISSEISGKQMSFLGDKTVASTATVSEYQSATTESQLEFALSADGTYYTVTGIGNEPSGVIAIPSYHNQKPVKAISDNAFYNISHITEVYLPGTLETIGANAFRNCASLDKIAIPSSVTVIGDHAFSGCDEIFIYCEAEKKPSGWSNIWNIHYHVSWGYGKK